jgi:hypothetical protein
MDDLKSLFPERFNASGAMDYAWFETEIRPRKHIYFRRDVNSLSFTLQDGPIKEVGVNGCQVDTLIAAAKLIIEGFNSQFPCDENVKAICALEEALVALDDRKKNREARGVEGLSKE